MILSKDQILKEIKKKRIKIAPYSIKNVGPASIDLTLDNRFRTFNGNRVDVDEKVDYKEISELKILKEIVLKPGEFVLGITKEKISLPSDICGWLTGRSRFARFGLQIHSTAAFIQPGIDNKQVLEICNTSSNELVLKPGLKICQIVLERMEGKAKYTGKFKSQSL